MHPNRLPLGVSEAEAKRAMATTCAIRDFGPDTMLWVVAGTVKRLRDKGYTVTGEFTDEGGYKMTVTGSAK
jgi:hypothetical protein